MQTISKGGIQWQTMIFFFFNLERNPDAEVFLNLHISPQNGRVCDTVLLGATFGKWLHFYPHSFTAGLEARPFSWRPLMRWQEAHGRSVCHEGAPLISCFQDKNTNTLGQNVLRTGAWMAWLWKALVILKQLHSNKRNLECQKSDHFTQHFLRQSFNSFFFFNRYLIMKACKAANTESRLLWCRSHYKVTKARKKHFTFTCVCVCVCVCMYVCVPKSFQRANLPILVKLVRVRG